MNQRVETQMVPHEELAIALVAYGSLSPKARRTYEEIRSAYEKAFPGVEVLVSFTSESIRRRLSDKDGVSFCSPLAALAELQDRGYRDVVVQSLQVVAGSEFHQVASLVHALRSVRGKLGFNNMNMGMPLLTSIDDCTKVSRALGPVLNAMNVDGEVSDNAKDKEDMAIILMGHGAGDLADGAYSQMARVLEKDYRNVFLGTLDGIPGIDEILDRVRRSGARRIRLMSFLLVAGGHALEDLAGDGPGSWRSTFDREGFVTEVSLKGLGEDEKIVEIFIEHTRMAARGFKEVS